MIAAMLLSHVLRVLAGVALIHVVWWLVGDFLLEHVGVPFLDGGSTRKVERPEATASDRRPPSHRRAMHARRPQESREAIGRPATYERDKRMTGMSRDVRA